MKLRFETHLLAFCSGFAVSRVSIPAREGRRRRLLQTIFLCQGRGGLVGLANLMAKVESAVRRHRGGMEARDDPTMLVLRMRREHEDGAKKGRTFCAGAVSRLLLRILAFPGGQDLLIHYGPTIFRARVHFDGDSDCDKLYCLFVVTALIVAGLDGALLLGDLLQKKE